MNIILIGGFDDKGTIVDLVLAPYLIGGFDDEGTIVDLV